MKVTRVRVSKSAMSGLGSALLERKGRIGTGFGLAFDMICLALLALAIARIIWVLLSAAAFVDMTGRTTEQVAAPRVETLQADPRIFSRFNPFDRQLVQSEDAIEESAPETSLNLQIRSLIASTDPESSSVRLQLPDNSVKRFSVGDRVVNGVTLERILEDRVILSRSGQREVLYAYETRVLDIDLEGRQDASARPETGAQSEEDDAPTSQTVDLTNVRVESMDVFYNGIRLRREVDDAGQIGLIIQSNSDPVLLETLSLVAGDRLDRLNGYDLNEDSVSDLYPRLRDETQLELDFTRDGRAMSRTIVIGRLAGESNE